MQRFEFESDLPSFQSCRLLLVEQRFAAGMPGEMWDTNLSSNLKLTDLLNARLGFSALEKKKN